MGSIPWNSVVTSVVVVSLALAAWQWQASVRHIQEERLPERPWEHVREQVAMPKPVEQARALSAELLRAIGESNPFSPLRRTAPEPEVEAPDEPVEPTPKAAQFVYKGRIIMGRSERAVLEDLTAGKTHFLQAGQEVAGFKVLDILENEVVLSAVASGETLTLRLTPKP